MEKEKISPKIFVKMYWDYYIELEKQLLGLKRYIDFSHYNNDTFSLELLKLLQAVCSEIDVVAKIIDKYEFPEFESGTIAKWGYYLQQIVPDIHLITVIFNDDYEVTPWDKWEYTLNKKNTPVLKKGCTTPDWWTAYNKSKHQRTDPFEGKIHYCRANLGNVIKAFSGLFVLEMLFFDHICKKENCNIEINNSRLFAFKKEED